MSLERNLVFGLSLAVAVGILTLIFIGLAPFIANTLRALAIAL
jgi:hypothetical protein